MNQNTSDDLFQDLSPEQRKQAMLDQGAKVEEQFVKRPYTEDELAAFKDALSSDMIELNRIESELDAIKDEYKIKMKPLKTKVAEVLTDLRLKYRENEEEVYMIADWVGGTMNTYDADGKFIGQRKLYPHERQTKIVNMNKAVNE